MAAETSAKGSAGGSLPPITVAKMEDAAALIERIVKEQTRSFGENIQEYRDARQGTSERRLTAVEASQVGAGMLAAVVEAGDESALADPAKFVSQIQDSDLRARDEVPMQEVLLAAGLATAPALIGAVKRMVALVEMPSDVHRDAREGSTLDDAIAKGAEAFDYIELSEARARASAALEHFQAAAGADSGEAWSLIVQMVGQALGQAIDAAPNLGSEFASLTGSLTPTDGTAE